MHEIGQYSISDLAELFSVARPTVYQTLSRYTPILEYKTAESSPQAALSDYLQSSEIFTGAALSTLSFSEAKTVIPFTGLPSFKEPEVKTSSTVSSLYSFLSGE